MSSERQPPDSFLGVGWGFPPSFVPGGGELVLAAGVDKVHQSLEILLMTRPGERPLSEALGCDLDAVLFEEADHALVGRIRAAISDAVVRHEPRVILHDVDVDPAEEPGVLRVRLTYGVPGTNSRFNMVFPFYLNEASTPPV